METPVKDEATKTAEVIASNPPSVPPQFVKADGQIDVEGIAKSLRESQQKITEQGQELAALKKTPPAGDALDAAFKAEVTSTKVTTWENAKAEIAAEGKVSEETRAALKKAYNADDAVIDGLVTGHQAQRAAIGARLAEAAGGEQTMNEAIAFARSSMNEGQVKALRADLEGPNGELVMAGLVARMRSASPTPAREKPATGGIHTSVIGDSINTAAIIPFESMAAQVACFRDPRYKVNAAFREYAGKRMQATLLQNQKK